MSPAENGEDLELLLRRVLRQDLGLTAVVPADKWLGGERVLCAVRARPQWEQ